MKTASIDVKDMEKATGDNSFKRLEYWGIGSIFLVHYFGDHTTYVCTIQALEQQEQHQTICKVCTLY